MNTETFLSFLCELLAKSALIFTAVAVLNRAWVRASAAQRHLLWCAALATVLLLPLTRLIEPRWGVPLQRVHVELPQPRFNDVPSIETPSPPDTIPTPAAAVAVRKAPDWQRSLILVWAVGAGLLLTTRLLGSARLVSLRKATFPLLDARAQRMAVEVFRDLAIRKPVDLRVSPTVCVPLTWGSLRPVLALPAEALGWSDVRLAAALRHEAGHIARADHLTRWLAQLACIFYWPNPLVWIAARHLRAAQEEATDDLVLRGGTAPEEYAAQLLDLARTLALQHRSARCAVAMASPSTLENRMLAIVDEGRNRRPLGFGSLLGGTLAAALTLGLCTAAQLRADEKKAAGDDTSPKAPGSPQIMIEVKFVEISATARPKSKSSSLSTIFGDSPARKEDAGAAGGGGILTPPQFALVEKELNELKGAHVLSTPRVITLSGQKAMIEIGREVRYPTEYEKDGGAWKAKEFGTRKTGITFGALATANADGTLTLDLAPSIVEFCGFIDTDSGEKYPAKPKPDASIADGDVTPGVPAGHRAQPVFSERKITTSVKVQPGQTVVLGSFDETAESKAFPKKGAARRLVVFVSASIVNETPATANGRIKF